MEINWTKLAEIIKTQPCVGETDAGLSRVIGTSKVVISGWQSGVRDLPFLQKARMLDFSGYREELTQMLSIVPKNKQLILRKKLQALSTSWESYKELHNPKPFPPFSELIVKDDEAVKLPDGPSRVKLDKFGFALSPGDIENKE